MKAALSLPKKLWLIECRPSLQQAKPIAWHEHGSEDSDQPAVYQNFGISPIMKVKPHARPPNGRKPQPNLLKSMLMLTTAQIFLST